MSNTTTSGKEARLHGNDGYIKTVAIVGAGGHVGRHITQALLDAGRHTLTALVRKESTTQVPEGVRAVRVDYDNDDDEYDDPSAPTPSLVAALRGQDALVITMAVTAPRGTIAKLVRAAAAARVPYVLPNWFGHDPANDALCGDSLLTPLRDSVLGEVRRLGVSAYVLVACGFWYEFSLAGGPDRFGFDLRGRSVEWIGGEEEEGGEDDEVRITTTTWPQCARAVARVLSLREEKEEEDEEEEARERRPGDEEGGGGGEDGGGAGPATLTQFRNGTVYVSSFRVSQRDMFESVKRVTGTADSDWRDANADPSRRRRGEPAEARWREARAAVVERGDFSRFPRQLYSRFFVPGGGGDFQADGGPRGRGVALHNGVLGLPVEDLDEWTARAVEMAESGEVEGGGH